VCVAVGSVSRVSAAGYRSVGDSRQARWWCGCGGGSIKTLRRIFTEGEKIMLVFTSTNYIFVMNDGSQLWWCIRAGEFATEAMCG